ncbi:Kievitone hydratase [Neofusicoccum parvum]|nr:Kievitone hydratase [Neofusicoccum parvum]
MSVGSSMARCSVLDISNPANYWMDSSNITLNTNVSTQSVLHLDYGFLGFQGISADSTSTMRTWASLPTIGFNVTWESSSKVLFNAGSAMFWFGSSGNTHEWSMPAGITSGTLTLNGTQEISIDSANSLTWYDRQWGYAGPFGGNWTWFELHFKDDTKASIWAIDQGDAIKRFATVRTDMGTHVLSYDLLADWSNTWTSDCSGKTYPLSWTLRFQNGEELHMESIRDDQELCNVGQEAAYEGFIIASGSVLGKKPAFGLVEMTAA